MGLTYASTSGLLPKYTHASASCPGVAPGFGTTSTQRPLTNALLPRPKKSVLKLLKGVSSQKKVPASCATANPGRIARTRDLVRLG